ncbi:Olfactory receptor 1020 [Heterocephalus glaber]|uniref:Olfactory receptor 1020 n=1 Tax=Heterocephalus glaber TaxID=10181 RepID=G5B6T7_HETGA|nr:Olfactory receptor 1020 [Heterocephalus glaber]
MAMVEENCTKITEFILGLSDVPELRIFLFLVFLLIYGVIILANLGMMALIQKSTHNSTKGDGGSESRVCYTKLLCPLLSFRHHSTHPEALQMLSLENGTMTAEFLLVGFSDHPEIQHLLFAMFFSIYSVTLMGNLGMILLITISSPLHTPMYFFLLMLSLVDACYSSVIAPKLLVNLIFDEKTISYNGCAAQLYFFCFMVDTESFLLAAMAYDRYIAICNPMLYTVIMSKRVCCQLALGAFLGGTMSSIIHTTNTFLLAFCSTEINHFFCDITPLFSLSCTDTYVHDIILVVFASLVEAICLLTVLLSYVCIIAAILKTGSVEGRRKGFSTCASHLTVVTIYHGTLIFIYLRPSVGHSMAIDRVTSVFYTLIIPMLNPLIYSLRNKDVKNAFRKIIYQKRLS